MRENKNNLKITRIPTRQKVKIKIIVFIFGFINLKDCIFLEYVHRELNKHWMYDMFL